MNRALAPLKKFVRLNSREKVHAYEKVAETKSWNFESPNINTYNALKGSLWSITLRGLVIVNAAMLIYEYIFYPYDAKSVLTNKKLE